VLDGGSAFSSFLGVLAFRNGICEDLADLNSF